MDSVLESRIWIPRKALFGALGRALPTDPPVKPRRQGKSHTGADNSPETGALAEDFGIGRVSAQRPPGRKNGRTLHT